MIGPTPTECAAHCARRPGNAGLSLPDDTAVQAEACAPRADAHWMRRALRLASMSLGMTAPNPGVGCVLVKNNALIGAGRHRRWGDLHAETAALADARARGHEPAGATAYVTLAPCTRTGRQPPCVQALGAAGVVRVVAALADPGQEDPSPHLPGIGYEVGCLGALAAHIHGGFLCRITAGRPRITGKWAMTLDGFLAQTGGGGWISSPGALALSRRRRRAFDAIVIGAGTARIDDPGLLATRPRPHHDGRGPRRVVLGRTPVAATARLRDGAAQLLLCTGQDGTPDPHDPPAVARWLGLLGCNDVLVEGGSIVHAAWLQADLYDRLEISVGGLTWTTGQAVVRPGELGRSFAAETTWMHELPPVLVDSTTVMRLCRRR